MATWLSLPLTSADPRRNHARLQGVTGAWAALPLLSALCRLDRAASCGTQEVPRASALGAPLLRLPVLTLPKSHQPGQTPPRKPHQVQMTRTEKPGKLSTSDSTASRGCCGRVSPGSAQARTFTPAVGEVGLGVWPPGGAAWMDAPLCEHGLAITGAPHPCSAHACPPFCTHPLLFPTPPHHSVVRKPPPGSPAPSWTSQPSVT